ncbi:fasciclin domain-containing protein [Lutibacter sp. TH_r2]|uniref:fasciclin domain-containing protein n=1 Tax=Lutibacter sp. TH_r2 TaxID=3082083 RepID=UPI00295346E2|nr:fasciclin domain-containing protein [Lutibacter sp. TH_r2]MDV7188208.1 fasciclin domain-containing protein [Lutibacter sp. TH_r2]
MKKLLTILPIITIAFMAITFTSCDDDDDNEIMEPTTNSIVDFVTENSDNYGMLLDALIKADGDLATVLGGDGPFTVFAPNDTAFGTFLSANGFNSVDEVPTDVLSQILLNHVVSGSVQSSSLSTGYINSLSTATPNGENMNMYIDTSNGVRINGVSSVTGADNIVDNGVIHLVDAVIGLPTVVTFATADSTFSTLVAALTRGDQPDFVSTLSTANGTDPAPFTVFAPTNTAFGDLLTELGVSELDDIDTATLTATLNHHVVAGANVMSSALMDNMIVTTLGGDITANVSGGATLTDANGRMSNIVAVDVQTANGIIHVIDKVILPELPTNTIVDFVSENSDNYGMLLEALGKADGDLATVLDGDGPFTVFAPNDTAFGTFLSANGFNSIDEVPTDVLSQILLNHVVSGSVESTGLSTGYISTLSTATPNGENMNMFVDISNGVTLNGVSTVTTPDNIVDNGVIHLVDAVIGLPTVVTFATADSTFSTLVAALTRDDQPDFVSTLSTANGTDPAPFTVFAPTNTAFGDLLTELNVEGLDDIDTATLTATLNHHVVAGANVMDSALMDNMTITTLGGDITANVTGGATLTDANGRVSAITATNVQSSNGIIHVIDKVILPSLDQ